MKLVSDRTLAQLNKQNQRQNHQHRYVWKMRSRQQRKRRIGYWVACAVGIIILLLIMLGGYGLYNFKNAAQNSYYPAKRTYLRNPQKQLRKKGALSILFLGTDTHDLINHNSATRTMIVSTINKQTGKTTMTSLPNNVKVKSNGRSMPLDQVYLKDGTGAAIKSVQSFMKIPVDYYVLSDAKGLAKTAEQVGGVKITPSQTFSSQGLRFRQGQSTLMKRKQVRAYLKSSTGNGDQIQMRNKQVLMALFNKISHHPLDSGAANSLSDDVHTDLSFNDLERLAIHYRGAAQNKQHVSLGGDQSQPKQGALNRVTRDPRYQKLSPEQKQKALQIIRQNLGM